MGKVRNFRVRVFACVRERENWGVEYVERGFV